MTYYLIVVMIKKILGLIFIGLIFINYTYGQIPAGYYDGTAGLTGEALKTKLNTIIDNHTELSYDDAKEALKITDEDPENSNNVICLYTGWSYGKNDFGNGTYQWNREHVWSQSHGNFGYDPAAGTDIHHLRPTDASVNSTKGNKDFNNGGTHYIDNSGPTNCYYTTYSWEPRDDVKGDVARMIFYMAVRYEGYGGDPDLELVDYINSSPDNEPYYGNLTTLLQWHTQDPVDDWEINRNNLIYSNYQGNRNPFIDHPEFVYAVWVGLLPEPSNYVNNFSSHNIILQWNDAVNGILPDAYLILMSDIGFDDIQNPVDNVAVPDANDAKNIDYGVQQGIFKNLTPNTNYFFKIIPYTINGESINYKTDGAITQTMQQTSN